MRNPYREKTMTKTPDHISPHKFLDELRRRKVPACQATAEELADEIHGD